MISECILNSVTIPLFLNPVSNHLTTTDSVTTRTDGRQRNNYLRIMQSWELCITSAREHLIDDVQAIKGATLVRLL